MLNRLSFVTFFTVIISNLILLSPCFCLKDAFASPLEDNLKSSGKTSTLPAQTKVNSSNEFVLEYPHLTAEKKIANEKIELQETESQSFCSTLSHLTNTIKPNISSNSEKDMETPTSYCAEDLIGVVAPEKEEKKNSEPSLMLQENLLQFSQELPKTE